LTQQNRKFRRRANFIGTKFGDGESEGGQKFLPPNPLPFCPPERSVWRAKRAVSFVQKRFGFRQTNAPMFYVYLLLLSSGKIYKGSTSNLKNRFVEHKLGRVKSTKDRRPLKLIHYEAYLLKSDATRRERFLKTTEGRRLLKQQLKDLFSKNKAGSSGHATGRPVE